MSRTRRPGTWTLLIGSGALIACCCGGPEQTRLPKLGAQVERLPDSPERTAVAVILEEAWVAKGRKNRDAIGDVMDETERALQDNALSPAEADAIAVLALEIKPRRLDDQEREKKRSWYQTKRGVQVIRLEQEELKAYWHHEQLPELLATLPEGTTHALETSLNDLTGTLVLHDPLTCDGPTAATLILANLDDADTLTFSGLSSEDGHVRIDQVSGVAAEPSPEHQVRAWVELGPQQTVLLELQVTALLGGTRDLQIWESDDDPWEFAVPPHVELTPEGPCPNAAWSMTTDPARQMTADEVHANTGVPRSGQVIPLVITNNAAETLWLTDIRVNAPRLHDADAEVPFEHVQIENGTAKGRFVSPDVPGIAPESTERVQLYVWSLGSKTRANWVEVCVGLADCERVEL
jgi:hypothetical protein